MWLTLIVLQDGTEIFSGPGSGPKVQNATIKPMVNDGEELNIGSCCASRFECTLLNPGGELSIAAGDEITVYRVNGDDRRKVGLFTMEEPSRPSANRYHTWMDTRISAGVVELSKSITLTPILRAHTITAQDAYIDGVLTVSVARKSADYYQSVHYQFGSISGYMAASGGTAVFEERSKASKYLFEIPDDWDQQILNAKTGICTLTCKTYLGTEKIGETSIEVKIKTDGTFAPQIFPSVVDVNEAAIALTGNSSRLIRGVSTARATMSVVALRGATIKRCEINGVQTAALEIEAVQNGTFTFAAVDSRGWETKQVVNMSIISYFPPTAVVELDRIDMVNHILRITVKGAFFSKSFGAVSNTLSTNLRADGGEWQAMTQTRELNADLYTAELDLVLDYQTKHELEIEIKDQLNTLTIPVAIPKATPQTMEGDGWIRHNVPVIQLGSYDNYVGRGDADETGLEAWLNERMAEMPNMSSRMVTYVCSAVTGYTVCATLYKHDSKYASVLGHSYDGEIYHKSCYNGSWSATKKGAIG